MRVILVACIGFVGGIGLMLAAAPGRQEIPVATTPITQTFTQPAYPSVGVVTAVSSTDALVTFGTHQVRFILSPTTEIVRLSSQEVPLYQRSSAAETVQATRNELTGRTAHIDYTASPTAFRADRFVILE